MAEFKISDLGVIAVTLGMAVIIVTVMTLIIQGVQDVTPQETVPFGNQSLVWLGNNTPIGFEQPRVNTGSVLLYNNGTLINQGDGNEVNYTTTESSITIINTTSSVEWVTAGLNSSYSFRIGSAAFNATNNGLVGQNTFASFFPLVALAVIGALIIGLVIQFFRRPEDN